MRWIADSVAASFQEKCVCASHMPGISVAPAPSITVAAVDATGATERPTCRMRLPSTSTLPLQGGVPVPSSTRTLVKRTLSMGLSLLSGGPAGRGAGAGAHLGRAVELAVLHHRQDAALVLQHGDV